MSITPSERDNIWAEFERTTEAKWIKFRDGLIAEHRHLIDDYDNSEVKMTDKLSQLNKIMDDYREEFGLRPNMILCGTRSFGTISEAIAESPSSHKTTEPIYCGHTANTDVGLTIVLVPSFNPDTLYVCHAKGVDSND